MQLDYVKISCKEDVHIHHTNFAKKIEQNLHETTSHGKQMENDCLSRTLKFKMKCIFVVAYLLLIWLSTMITMIRLNFDSELKKLKFGSRKNLRCNFEGPQFIVSKI